jgi:flagellar hook-associated protein 1
MSLSSILNIARSALLTQQRAMSVTAHNVANAETPGYTRQRMLLNAATPIRTANGDIGRGVTDRGVTRARDSFFDSAYRRENGMLGSSSTLRDLLGEVEAAIHEPSDVGIASALDDLFQSFGDLANDPSSRTHRDLVRSAAARLAQGLNSLDTQITEVTTETAERLRSEITQANNIAAQIASLNVRILGSGAEGAPDVMDERDLLVDQLSNMVDVRVVPQEDGTVSILSGDTMIIERGSARQMEIKPHPSGGYGIGLSGDSGLLKLTSGSIQALSEMTVSHLPDLRDQLDGFTQAVVNEINAIHRTGYTATGDTNTNFFDSTGTTARTIRLTDAIKNSSDAIAAGETPETGDNAVALRIAALATTRLGSIGNKTLRDFYTDIAASVGSGVSDATTGASVHESLVDHADTMRSGAGGVSIDEEMVNLISQQEAYSAASRMVQVANEMIQDILDMI